jgi:putative transposase
VWKSKFPEERVAFAHRQVKGGAAVEQVCRKTGVGEATSYRWRMQFGGMGVVEPRRPKPLEDENRKLKGLAADLSPDEKMLHDVLSKNVRPRPGDARWRRGCWPPTGRSVAACALPAGEPAVRQPSRPAGLPSAPPARPGRGVVPPRWPAPSRPAASGGLGGQPQADLPPLRRGGLAMQSKTQRRHVSSQFRRPAASGRWTS